MTLDEKSNLTDFIFFFLVAQFTLKVNKRKPVLPTPCAYTEKGKENAERDLFLENYNNTVNNML